MNPLIFPVSLLFFYNDDIKYSIWNSPQSLEKN